MKKILQLFSKQALLLCLILISSMSWGQTESITIDLTSLGGASNIGTNAYASGAERTWSQGGVTFGTKATTGATSPNAGAIQAQANNGLLYNKTALPGKLISIEITSWSGTTDRVSTLTVGDTDVLVNSISGNYTANGNSLGASTPGSWTISSGDFTYFAIKRGGSAAYWSQIVITYEIESAPTAAPEITAATVTGSYNTAVNYQVVASNSPTSYAIVLGALPNGLSMNGTTGVIAGTPTEVGSFSINVTATNDVGTSAAATINFEISKANQTITFEELADLTYGAADFNLAATSSSGLPLTYTSSNTAVATVSGTTVTVVGIGSTDLTASQAGDANYNPAADSVQSLNITTKTLTITGITAMDKLQDGTTAAAVSGTAVLNGIVAGDEAEVVLSGTPTATFASALPGTGIAVSVTGYAITGAKASNYSLTQPELTATITTLEIPVATPATTVTTDSFTANWNAVPGATGYELDVYEKIETYLPYITVVGWDFSDENIIADSGLSTNNTSVLSTNATGLSFTNPANADGFVATTSGGWNSGSGSKNWKVSFTTLNINNIKISSLQRSSNTGPKDFKVQYSLDNTVWTDATNAIITVANDYTSGVLTDIALPVVCENKSLVYLRWVMTSNMSVNNSTVAFGGTSAIDNILIKGDFNSISTEDVISNQNVGNVTSYEVSGLNPNTHYFYVVRAVNGTASSNSNEVAATTSGPFLWTGATNNSWSEASNWFGNAVPDGSKDVLIASGTPVLDTDYTLPAATSLVLADTAVLTLAPTATLTIAGSADFGGQSVVLQSDATGTAAIGQVTGTLANATNVTVERYIPAKRAWRFLTAPLQGTSNNALVANWQGVAEEGALLFAPATYQSQTMTGYAVGGNAPNIFKYNAGWQAIPDLASEIMFGATANDTQAYQIFVTGASNSTNIATGATATTLRPKGALITGTVNHNLTANAYKLLPNPYASPIDTEAMVANNAGSKVWLLDPTIGFGAYVTYDGLNWSAPISGTDKNIQSGQGFFVKSTATSFAVQEAFKVNGNSNTWFERASNTENATKIRVLLYKQNATDWQLADAILAVNSLNGNTAVDAADASKIANYNESLMFRNGTSNLAIEYRALPQANEMQPLRLTGTTATGYQLRIHLESFNESSLVPLLEDTQLGTFTAIPTDGTPVIIPFTGVASTATNPDDRFRMVYQTALSNDSFESLNVVVYPNPVSNGTLSINVPQGEGAIFELYNVLGQKVQQGELAAATNSVDVSGLQSGVYIVTVVQSGKKFTTKIMVGSH